MATINSHQSESRQVLGINNTDGTALVIDHVDVGEVIELVAQSPVAHFGAIELRPLRP